MNAYPNVLTEMHMVDNISIKACTCVLNDHRVRWIKHFNGVSYHFQIIPFLFCENDMHIKLLLHLTRVISANPSAAI